jgi:hypothetical protein
LADYYDERRKQKYKTTPPLQGKVSITFILAKAETSKQYISLQNVNQKLVRRVLFNCTAAPVFSEELATFL